MAMGYIRWELAAESLRDCERNLGDERSAEEEKFKKEVLEICRRLIEKTGGKVVQPPKT